MRKRNALPTVDHKKVNDNRGTNKTNNKEENVYK